MRTILFGLFSLMVIIGLAACEGEETQGKEISLVESSEEENKTNDAEEHEESVQDEEGTAEEFDEIVADNDTVKATLVSVEHIIDEDWDEERYEIKFEVENKGDETIEVQAREVSTDGKMVDESMIFMSQEVSGGKLADAVLTIESYSEDGLPDMEDNLEMILHIFSWDDMEALEDIDVKIEF